VQRGEYLVTREGECWRGFVIVTARFGFEQTPAEIVEATLEIAIAIWRGRDSAYARVVADANGGQTVTQAIPDRAKLIVAEWKRKQPVAFA